jgi:hypothetical protein
LRAVQRAQLLDFLAAGAVGGDAGAGVHLAVELGEEDEGEPGAQVGRAGGALPDRAPVVEAVPDLLGALAISSELMVGWGVNILGRTRWGSASSG